MKKAVILLICIMCFMGIWAEEFKSLTFTKSDGSKVNVSVTDLVLSISGTSLVITNNEGTNSLTLTDLAKMNFTDLTTNISEIDNSEGKEVMKIYSIQGICQGEYKSLNDAMANLPKGIYIAKSKSGITKITVQ